MKIMCWSSVASLLILFAAAGAATPEEDAAIDIAVAKKSLAAAKITLAKAVEIAMKRVSGKAVEAELLVDEDKLQFLVEIVADGKHTVVAIDPTTGEVDEEEELSDESLKEHPEELKAEAAVIDTPTTLSQAIAAAMKEFPAGKCLEAYPQLGEKTPKVFFQVELLVGEKIREVHVDAAKGTSRKIAED